MIKVPITLVCDGCGKEEPFVFTGTFTASGHLKYEEASEHLGSSSVYKGEAEGWKSTGIFGDCCPECAEKEIAFRALKEISEEGKEPAEDSSMWVAAGPPIHTVSEARADHGLPPLPGEDK